MNFYDVLRQRRMVRAFSDAALDPAALERIVDAGRRGPSAGFSQGIELVVVTDPAIKRAISAPAEELAKKGVVGFVEQAPAAIIVCTSEERYTGRYREPDKAHVRRDVDDDAWWLVPYWYVDAGAAVMAILLAAVNEGLGAGLAGLMGSEGQERVRRAVGMPASYTAVAILAIGHPAEGERVRGSAASRKRRSKSDVVHRERW